jgi:hypothetical protein
MAWVPWRTPDEVRRRPHFRELVLTAVPLEHADAEQLANSMRTHFVLQRMWQPGAPTISAAGRGVVLLHGYRDQIAQTIDVLHQIDLATTPAPSPPTAAAMARRLEALEREVAALRRELAERR